MASNSVYVASALGFGPFTWLFGVLEPAVAGYALRLYRILGARVGWWVFATFSLLALGHAFHSSETWRLFGSPVSFDLVTLLIPFLLLIGMVHTESTMVAQARVSRKERDLRVQKESQAQQRMAELVREAKELRERVACLAEREKALGDSAQQYQLLFTNNPEPMWVFDLRSLQILAVNAAAQARYGFSMKEFMGRAARDLFPAQEAEGFLRDVSRPANDGQSRGTWRQCHKDGSVFEIEVRAIDLKYADRPARLVLASDSMRCRRDDSTLQHEQKMELISNIVSTAARHFDNLPVSISIEVDRLLGKPVDSEVGESLKRISAAASRANTVVQQLLTVGSQRLLEMQALDFNRFLTQLEPAIQRVTSSSISFEKHYATDRLFIMADSHLLEHVVLNLVLNARHAMPRGGTLSFETSMVSSSNSDGKEATKEATFVRFTVRDSGCGISPEIQAHLFEPFFAKGQMGENKGLGLASTYGAMKQLGGWIEVASEVGAGTEFNVYFPTCPAPAPVMAPTGVSAAAKTILLVEPDSRMRMSTRTALEWSGYRVVETDSSSLAMTLWPGQAANIDLLFTELALPGTISGLQLAERLRREKPGLKVLYAHDPSKGSDRTKQLKVEELVARPFTSVELLESVSRCLAEIS